MVSPSMTCVIKRYPGSSQLMAQVESLKIGETLMENEPTLCLQRQGMSAKNNVKNTT